MTENTNTPAISWDADDIFIYRYTVLPEDIDVLGHANNSRYLVWMEKAAIAHSETLDLGWDRWVELGVACVARRTEMNYLSEAVEGDNLLIGTWISQNEGRAMMWRSYQIVRESDQRAIMRARMQWAVVEMETKRPIRQPEAFATGYAAHRNQVEP